jgi:hypothetical protein
MKAKRLVLPAQSLPTTENQQQKQSCCKITNHLCLLSLGAAYASGGKMDLVIAGSRLHKSLPGTSSNFIRKS